eukprot:scaffold91830_cov86-Phaeocystis_antarctica.AAC.1
MAADNVEGDFFAVAAHKSETRLNLARLLVSGWLSQHPILMKTPEEDSFLWGFESNMHCACTQHAFRHGSNFHRRSSNSLADDLSRHGGAAALGGAEQGARRSARTMPSPVRSPPAIQQQD